MIEKLNKYMQNMGAIRLQFAEIKRICEDEVDPTKNVKYKIQKFFTMGSITFEQNQETLDWSFK